MNVTTQLTADLVRIHFERNSRIRRELEAAMMQDTKANLIQMAVGIMGQKMKERVIDFILEDYSAKEIATLHRNYTSMDDEGGKDEYTNGSN